jgi:serpin B
VVDDRNDWLGATLQPLKTSPHGHEWPSTEVLQRRGTRRRQRRIAVASGGAGLALAVVLLVALLPSSGSGHTPGPARSALATQIRVIAGPAGSEHLVVDVSRKSGQADSATTSAVASAEQAFALQLTREELSEASSGNVLLSPMSAHIALAMLELGSAGATEREVAATLGSTGLSSSSQADGWNGLVQELTAAESSGELNLANSLWVAKGVAVESEFLREAAATFGEDTYEANFRTVAATNAINAWVAQETAGRIKELYAVGDLMPSTELVLANALHFHAAWQDQLFEQATLQPEPFFTSTGARVTVPTLVSTPEHRLSASQTQTYEAVQIPYTNGRFAALLIQPESGSLTSFLKTMSPAGLATLMKAMRVESVELSMPELHLAVRESLKEPLSAMGMAQTFNNADFSPMLGPSAASNQAVGGVQQAASLDVDQWGTDAAAATGVSVIPAMAEEPQMRLAFNHPYLFLIRDTKTGTILFSSVVNNPAEG